MTEPELLQEEIKEQEAEIFRLKRSMNKQDNGVKVRRVEVLSRTVDRLKALAKKEAAI